MDLNAVITVPMHCVIKVFSSSYEDLMFGEDEEKDRPGAKAKKKVKMHFLSFPDNTTTCFFVVLCMTA